MQLINQNNSFLNDRGFKSLHCHRRSDSELQKKRNTGVTQQTCDEAKKAREVMLLVRGLADQKTAWMWGSR